MAKIHRKNGRIIKIRSSAKFADFAISYAIENIKDRSALVLDINRWPIKYRSPHIPLYPLENIFGTAPYNIKNSNSSNISKKAIMIMRTDFDKHCN